MPTRKAGAPGERIMTAGTGRKCSTCYEELQFVQNLPFTVKETHGTGTLQLGEWGELVDDRLWFNVYVCPQYGEVRLVADDTAKRRLLWMTLKVV